MVGNPPVKDLSSIAGTLANTVVLVVSDSENVAKRIESHMRNAGYPVRAAWVTDLEDLEDVLTRGAPDLLLCADNMQNAPLRPVIELATRLCPDLPVLLLTNRYTADASFAALAAGARDQVAYDDPRHMQHLEMACLRELTSHQNQRELRAARARLAEFELRHKQQIAESADAVAYVQEGIMADVNPAFAQLLGYAQPAELLSLPLMDLVCPDFQARVKEQVKLLNKGKVSDKPVEFCLLKSDGSKLPVSAEFTLSRVNGDSFIELTIAAETKAAGAEMVSGRMDFLEALASRLQQGQPKLPTAAVFMAVDQFSAFEDRLGFRDAEETIIKLMDWVRTRLLPQDQLFRFSTGELAAIVSRQDVAHFEQLGESLCQESAKQIFATQGHEAQVTVSIAAYPFSGGEQATLIVNDIAREARKLAARGGKQSVVLGPTAKNTAAEREEQRKAGQVKKAIEENRLKLAYQSIASLEGDTRQHFDVLVRMMDETGHELQAGEFLPAAEKFGLMRVIDRWVTARVLKLISKRESSEAASSLFVKVSEDSLKDAEAFASWLVDTLKSRPLKPGELVFEFQELRLQNHIRKAKALTKALRDLGASIAIEHFGASTNSQQLLEHIPASYVKFHANFTHQFNDKEMFKKMAQLMESAKQRNMKTIVCHVEDANVMARLWQMGVNFIQGYHVQEPEVVLLSAELSKR